jgi:hypothetical protein
MGGLHLLPMVMIASIIQRTRCSLSDRSTGTDPSLTQS